MDVPVSQKTMLTVSEACSFYSIGEKSLRSAMRKPNCTFVFFVGRKMLLKRKAFEEYVAKHDSLH